MAEILKVVAIPLDDIYVPTKLRKPLDPKAVEALAESIVEIGQQAPILVRRDKERFVLVSGLHRIEACRMLGETTIKATIVQSRKY
jgi:ParB-like chromosome segregation protein Spo0J